MTEPKETPDFVEVEIELDKKRTLRLDFYATRQFKKLTKAEGFGKPDVYGRPTGISIHAGELKGMEFDEEITPLFLAACLRHADPTVDGDLVARWVTGRKLVPVAAALEQCCRHARPGSITVTRGARGQTLETASPS